MIFSFLNNGGAVIKTATIRRPKAEMFILHEAGRNLSVYPALMQQEEKFVWRDHGNLNRTQSYRRLRLLQCFGQSEFSARASSFIRLKIAFFELGEGTGEEKGLSSNPHGEANPAPKPASKYAAFISFVALDSGVHIVFWVSNPGIVGLSHTFCGRTGVDSFVRVINCALIIRARFRGGK